MHTTQSRSRHWLRSMLILACFVALSSTLSACKKIGPSDGQAWEQFKVRYKCTGRAAGESPYGGSLTIWTCGTTTIKQHGAGSVPTPRELASFERMMASPYPGPWLAPSNSKEAESPLYPKSTWTDTSQHMRVEDQSSSLLPVLVGAGLIGVLLIGMHYYRRWAKYQFENEMDDYRDSEAYQDSVKSLIPTPRSRSTHGHDPAASHLPLLSASHDHKDAGEACSDTSNEAGSNVNCDGGSSSGGDGGGGD